MAQVVSARLAEIADLAPQLAEQDEQLRTRRSDLDRRYQTLRRTGEPIPAELLAEQRRVREQLTALRARRQNLLDELAGHRPELAQRQSLLRSHDHARALGVIATGEEYATAPAELRTTQATLDRARGWLDGTTLNAKRDAEVDARVIAAIEATCHDPLSFDSNDW